MDSTRAQTGPITSHHQLGDGRRTIDLWKKSGDTPHPRNRNLTKKIQSGTIWDHPQAYKSPEIHLGDKNLPPTFTPDEEHYEKEKRQRR